MTDIQAFTARLPQDLYESLRRESYETREPMNAIIISALRLFLTERPQGETNDNLPALRQADH